MVGMSLLALLIAGTTPSDGLHHRSTVQLPTGAAAVDYRGRVEVEHRQIGTAGAPGRPSTLRCVWRASLAVDRQAQHATGAFATRSLATETSVGGARQGWCEGQKRAIAQEVAARRSELHGHLLALAQEDHSALRIELDRMHSEARTG